MKRIQQGFTLIELMIVIAIIGILAAVAIPSYNAYIETTKMGKVTEHVDVARRYAEDGMAKDVSRRTMNIPYNAANDLPRNTGDILTQLNTVGATAPDGGGAPYAAAASAATGTVGVAATLAGAAWAPGDTIVITPPAGYLELTNVSHPPITITY